MGGPILEGDAAAAVAHRGSHVQIIASAGSGKTEVVAQRVASLVAEGNEPSSIVAFTFTERAAAELKARVALRLTDSFGPAALDRLGQLSIGTIHAFCFRFLQQRVPRFETYDVLDDHQLTAFLSRSAKDLGLRALDPDGRERLFASIAAFQRGVDVVENELLDPAAMDQPFRTVLLDYYDALHRYRLLTFGQQVAGVVAELGRPEVAAEVHGGLRHLIVDEYQDVNPAQERLIELLTGPQTELCVVGDDDQAIYQWRGSDVGNIVGFSRRHPNVASFSITTNRRSRPQIIATANRVADTIPGRLAKVMGTSRAGAPGGEPEVVLWAGDSEAEEAGWITFLVDEAHDAGLAYRDIAILVRSRAAYGRIVEALAAFGVPVQPGGRTGLFDQPEARLLGRTLCWLSDDVEWRDGFGPGTTVTEDALIAEHVAVFELAPAHRAAVLRLVRAWKEASRQEARPSNLVGELYEYLEVLGVAAWDLDDPLAINRLGTFARCTALLADYEMVRRRARPDPDQAGEQIGGSDRGRWYYFHLAVHVVNYAAGAYEGFDGENDATVDAVDLTTIHRAKGLEWPVVFVPSLTAARFPSSRTGRPQPWPIPRDRFPAARYEGSDADERRLFYVAMSRARDWLSVSRHARTAARNATASPYFLELSDLVVEPEDVRLPALEPVAGDDEALTLSYSELASYLSCGMAYRLRTLIGFQPRLATELGYGKAVHHLLRAVAEHTRASGAVPTGGELDELFRSGFFLPTANRVAHAQLKDAARRLVGRYVTDHEADLHRVWETERPFELHLAGITIQGRADVILDHEGGVATDLSILDYKTSTTDLAAHALQLQVYAEAGRREGLGVRAAYVHDLGAGSRSEVAVDPATVAAAQIPLLDAAERLRRREFTASPGPGCRRCEVRTVCGARQP